MISKFSPLSAFVVSVFLSAFDMMATTSVSIAAEPVIKCRMPDGSTVQTSAEQCKAAKGRVL